MQLSIPTKYWMLLTLIAWGGLILGFGLIRLDPFGIDEGAAMALLLNWSVSDQIINSSITFGGPDFRGLLFFPVGLYWPGSILAAKVFTIIIMFAAAMMLYSWCREKTTHETALIATGLLLILPATILQIDTMAIGSFCLFLFGLGAVLDKKYRASPHSISSLYFTQMLLVATSVTLHPIGLAYPLALAWQWYRSPKSSKQQKQIWYGIGIAVTVVAVMQTGWIDIAWFSNPLVSLSRAFFGYSPIESADTNWLIGLVPLIVVVMVIINELKQLENDLLLNSLIFGALIGLFAADISWALLVLVIFLYRGTPLLLFLNNKITSNSFAGKRGIVMVVMFVLATLFMQNAKAYAIYIASGVLSPKDELINKLAIEAQDAGRKFLGASQWPAQTMIATRRDILPIPGSSVDEDKLIKSFNKLTHIIFDQNDPHNTSLSQILAKHTELTETIAILPSGVLIQIRQPAQTTMEEKKPLAPIPN